MNIHITNLHALITIRAVYSRVDVYNVVSLQLCNLAQ